MISPAILLSFALFSADLKESEVKTPAILIDAASLDTRMKSEKLRILDARSAGDYRGAHIPGAVRVDVDRWKTLAHSKGGFENAKAWAEEVGKLGIDGKGPVVVYGSRPTDTARVWWTLKYLGIKEVLFLDGGWTRWQKEKKPVDAKKTVVSRIDFVPKFQKDRLATTAEVKKAVEDGGLVIVDTRSDGEFTGKVVRGPRGGHVPGAVHLEWTRLMASDGRFKKPDEIRKILGRCGIVKGKPLVPY